MDAQGAKILFLECEHEAAAKRARDLDVKLAKVTADLDSAVGLLQEILSAELAMDHSSMPSLCHRPFLARRNAARFLDILGVPYFPDDPETQRRQQAQEAKR